MARTSFNSVIDCYAHIIVWGAFVCVLIGCRTPSAASRKVAVTSSIVESEEPVGDKTDLELIAYHDPDVVEQEPTLPAPESTADDALSEDVPSSESEDKFGSIVPPTGVVTSGGLTLDEVIRSVYETYPLLHAAITQRQQAAGQQLTTWGQFDRQLNASSENKYVGFYENYRHQFGVKQNIYERGGQWSAKYQLGRGEFEPWYLEREKNEGGEFSVQLIRPLKRGRDIDNRRAAIWRATYEQQRVEPAIQRDLIAFVFDGSMTYWDWIAAGQRYQLAQALLDVAETRNQQIVRRVELGDLDPPLTKENKRLVLKRQGTLLAAEQKLTQAAAKLSLFYRDELGQPLVVTTSMLPTTVEAVTNVPSPFVDLETALSSRPEVFELEAERRKVNVSLAEARNNLLPRFDVYAIAAQDVGGRTSSADDKQEFDFESGLYFDVPIERRAARGQIADAEAKLARISAKQQMAQDKISVELTQAAAAIDAAVGRAEAARESIDLARELVRIELRRFELGDASLLEVTLREQQLAESAEDLIAAERDLHVANAAYRAALGTDRL